MIAYRAHYLDDAGCFTHAEWVRALNDDEAILRARKFVATSVKCELWQGARVVARLTLDDWTRPYPRAC